MSRHANPRPFQCGNSGRVYAKRRYSGFFQKLVASREHYLATRLLRQYAGKPGAQAVDIPCGYGRFYPLLKQLGFRVTAMDQSAAMVEICGEQPGFQDCGDRALTADILNALPDDVNEAEVALCVRLFQHLHTREVRLKALQTLGANNRHVVMTYYDSGCLHYWTKRLVARLRGKRVRINMLSRAQFESELAEVGMRIGSRNKLLPGIHAQTWVTLLPAKQSV